jgi:flagellar biosynthetic protein FlhB
MGRLTIEFLALIAVLAGTIGALDYFWQRAEHRRQHRMSHKELRDEAKEAEGDPWLKQERRSRAEAIAANRMMSEVPHADVVIVNPTHVAVALRWSRAPGAAPAVIASGKDEIARRIREIAEAHGVPIYSDPATARALVAEVALEQEIPPEHYRAVAAAIRFAEAMRRRARRGWH